MKKKRNFKKSYNKKEMARIGFIRDQLINSRGAICGICGEAILTKKDCTVDHIIPLHKGGTTTIENCQLAHFGCNQRKGSK